MTKAMKKEISNLLIDYEIDYNEEIVEIIANYVKDKKIELANIKNIKIINQEEAEEILLEEYKWFLSTMFWEGRLFNTCDFAEYWSFHYLELLLPLVTEYEEWECPDFEWPSYYIPYNQ